MAANVEIKARVADLEALEGRVQALSGGPGKAIVQRDVFFRTARGRLKLRVVSPAMPGAAIAGPAMAAPGTGSLIYYERADTSGPSRSNYVISRIAEPESLQGVLAACLGIRGIVNKRRTLHWVGLTRIHLDQVEGLGSFMELEAVLGPGQTEEDGYRVVSELMRKLQVKESDLVEVAYIDLLE
jgi:adenylate cyclase class IV